MSHRPIPTRTHIVRLYRLGLLAEELGQYHEGDFNNSDSFALSCAAAHNEGQIDLLAVVHEPAFLALDQHEFFVAQQVYCTAIPSLMADPDTLMNCCRELVRRAGNDLAGSQPNGAFRQWCANHPAEAAQVIADAKAGRTPAKDFLTFALQGTNNVEGAIDFVEGFSDERRLYGMTALGQLTFPNEESARSALAALAPFTHAPWEDRVRANALVASCSLLARHPNEVAAKKLIDAITKEPGTETLHALAQALSRWPMALGPEVTRPALNLLRGVEPASTGTVMELKHALYRMLDTPHEVSALDALSDMLGSGMWTARQFDIVVQKIANGPSERLHHVVVKWLLSGNFHLGNAVPELARSERKKGLRLDGELPALTDAETMFLCRRAVGFLFSQPRSCSSILVSVLRTASDDVRISVIKLLVNPLMMSYSGVREHLATVAESDAAYPHVRQALDTYRQYASALDAMETINELQPSERQRHLVRTRRAAQMRDAMKNADKQSVLSDLFHTSHVLHGRRTLTYVKDPDGSKRSVPMDLHQHSTSIELPSLEWLDPVGLSHALVAFRVMKQP